MTIQIGDILIHGNAQYNVRPFPLAVLGEGWRTIPGDESRSRRPWIKSTACRRGYVATWRIEHDRLYLVRIHGESPSLNMQSVFGTDRLFAFWFSGPLRSPFGESIRDTFDMFDTRRQFDHLWHFEFGVLTSRTIRHNPTPQPASPARGRAVSSTRSV